MARSWLSSWGARFLADYGMLGALALLAAFFSVATVAWQVVEGAPGAEETSRLIPRDAKILIVVGTGQNDVAFADTLADDERKRVGFQVVGVARGHPSVARKLLEQLQSDGVKVDVVAASPAASRWELLENVVSNYPHLGSCRLVSPHPYRWPNFLKTDNLRNIANQIAVIAILAVGMTLVVITGGIDLSVGSLIALSAVIAALLIWLFAGAEQASTFGMFVCCLAAVAVCALWGLFSGMMTTLFAIPSFIVTLAVMLMARGLAFLLSQGQSIHQVPTSFDWLGIGAGFLGIPNAVVLMLLLYAFAHVLMTRMTVGRYIYAVGGNAEAARLSGVPVRRVRLLVFSLCGALAGLGGVVMASQFKSGSPTYGQMYELYAIAAVVVGGTSLTGGEGKVLGTLIGALIIAVIQNGMNLTGVESYTQMVVLGAVLLTAVLLDQIKKKAWRGG